MSSTPMSLPAAALYVRAVSPDIQPPRTRHQPQQQQHRRTSSVAMNAGSKGKQVVKGF